MPRLSMDATVYIWIKNKNLTYTVASPPAVTGSAFMQMLRLLLQQCNNKQNNRYLSVYSIVLILPMVKAVREREEALMLVY